MAGGRHGHRDCRLTFGQDLSGLLLRNTLDLLKYTLRRISNRLDSLKTAICDQLDITLCKTSDTLLRGSQ